MSLKNPNHNKRDSCSRCRAIDVDTIVTISDDRFRREFGKGLRSTSTPKPTSKSLQHLESKVKSVKLCRSVRSSVTANIRATPRDLESNDNINNNLTFVPGHINLRFFLTIAAFLKLSQFILGMTLSALDTPFYFTFVLYLSTISSLFWIWVYYSSFNRKPENGQLSLTWLHIEMIFAVDWFVMYIVVSVLAVFLEPKFHQLNPVITLGIITGCFNGLDGIRLAWISVRGSVIKVAPLHHPDEMIDEH